MTEPINVLQGCRLNQRILSVSIVIFYHRICNAGMDLKVIMFFKLCIVKTSRSIISLQFQGDTQRFLQNSAAPQNERTSDSRHILTLHSMGITQVELRDALLAQTDVVRLSGREMNVCYMVKDLQTSIYATQYRAYIVEDVDLKLQCTSHQVSFRQCVSAPWWCSLLKII